MNDPHYLTGQFLLAMPGMTDPRFDHAVIAICSHDAEGAVGIGIGAVVAGLGLHDLLEQIEVEQGDAPDAPIHFGGPVETRRGFVLHSLDWSGQDTIDVAGRWALTGTIDVLRAIAQGTGPRDYVVSLGYAGWAAGQLDAELATPGWLNVTGDTDLIFATDPAARWTRAMAGAGVDPGLLVMGGGNA